MHSEVTGPPTIAPPLLNKHTSIANDQNVELRNDSLWFLVPSGLVLALVMAAPLFFAFYLSIFHYFLGQERMFAGLGNYVRLLTESRFWLALGRTIFIAACSVALEFWVGLLIAYGLYNLVRGARFFNVFLMLPNVITPVVSGIFLRWIFVPDWGLIAVVLRTFGLEGPDFFDSPFWARLTVIFADMWQFTPFLILVLFAGLNTVDRSQLEAAQIDGVGPWKILFKIMMPNIRPLIAFVLVVRMMDSFRFFDQIYVLTAGGPGTATETLAMYTYELGFRLLDIGTASALGVLTLAVEMIAVLAIIRIVYRKEKGAF